jgi:hypothetical protein
MATELLSCSPSHLHSQSVDDVGGRKTKRVLTFWVDSSLFIIEVQLQQVRENKMVFRRVSHNASMLASCSAVCELIHLSWLHSHDVTKE